MECILERLQEEFRAALSPSGDHERLYAPDRSKAINAIVGMRRSGKTKYLYQVAKKLLGLGIPVERLLYLNLEDDRLFPFIHSLRQLIDAWYDLYPEHLNERCYLFLDGVEKSEVWPLVLRKILDTRNVEIYITGTSAKFLEGEIAGSIKDRAHLLEILPFSYKELRQTTTLGRKELERHRQSFTNYLLGSERIAGLQNTIEKVILRDMVERHQIGNVALLKTFIHFLCGSATHPFSINKFYHDIKSQGIKVAKDTLHAYLAYLEEAFLLFAVPVFTESASKRETTPKKIYLGDTGLIAANTFKRPNLAKLFENQVYLDLRRKQKSIFYYPTKEGDVFVTQDSQGHHEIVQTHWDSEPNRAIEMAQSELGFPAKLFDFKTYMEEL